MVRSLVRATDRTLVRLALQPKIEPTKPKTVRVRPKYGKFIDLVKNVTIEGVMEVELHPWLQANIDRGLLVVEAE